MSRGRRGHLVTTLHSALHLRITNGATTGSDPSPRSWGMAGKTAIVLDDIKGYESLLKGWPHYFAHAGKRSSFFFSFSRVPSF